MEQDPTDPRNFILSESDLERLCLSYEEGWVGVLTRANAPGAIKSGKRIVKVMRDGPGERPVGSPGTVIGSISHPELGIAYFVEWDTLPKHSVFVAAKKIAEAS